MNSQIDSITLGILVQQTVDSVAKKYQFDPKRLPGLQYAHGRRGQDAWVENVAYLPNTENTLILGSELLMVESASDIHYGLIGVALVIAHEMTHIHQIETQMVGELKQVTPQYTRILELHADWLAGWYLGLDNSWTQNFIDYASRRIQGWGDSCTNSVYHHGFGSEREAKMHTGWERAKYGDLGFAEESAYAKTELTRYVLKVPPGTDVC